VIEKDNKRLTEQLSHLALSRQKLQISSKLTTEEPLMSPVRTTQKPATSSPLSQAAACDKRFETGKKTIPGKCNMP